MHHLSLIVHVVCTLSNVRTGILWSSGDVGTTTTRQLTESARRANVTWEKRTDRTARPRRHKRFDYEDTYQWQDDDDLTYESYYEEEEAEPNLFQKVALHWRTAGPRLVFLGAILVLVTLICCGCLRLACRFWCKSMSENCACCGLPGVKQTCQMCYTDPMYERVKDLGEAMGIEISFNTYEMIKERYTPDTGFDPAAMPLLM